MRRLLIVLYLLFCPYVCNADTVLWGNGDKTTGCNIISDNGKIIEINKFREILWEDFSYKFNEIEFKKNSQMDLVYRECGSLDYCIKIKSEKIKQDYSNEIEEFNNRIKQQIPFTEIKNDKIVDRTLFVINYPTHYFIKSSSWFFSELGNALAISKEASRY